MEVTILATVQAALAGRHLLESSEGTRTNLRTVVSLEEAEGLETVLSAKDVREDLRPELCEAY
jgi:hypothetical protein